MNPNEAAKRIGTELGQSNPKGDARLEVDLGASDRYVVDGDCVNGYGVKHSRRICKGLTMAQAVAVAKALADTTPDPKN